MSNFNGYIALLGSSPQVQTYRTPENPRGRQAVHDHPKAAFPGGKLVDITTDAIEEYLRRRLQQRVRVKLARRYREKGVLESTTVHQEFSAAPRARASMLRRS
jgi:hypothetical protein